MQPDVQTARQHCPIQWNKSNLNKIGILRKKHSKTYDYDVASDVYGVVSLKIFQCLIYKLWDRRILFYYL